jgi:hypothetical protein
VLSTYLAPNSVLGSDQIGGHGAQEVVVDGVEYVVLGLRDELRPVPHHRQLPVLSPLPLLKSPKTKGSETALQNGIEVYPAFGMRREKGGDTVWERRGGEGKGNRGRGGEAVTGCRFGEEEAAQKGSGGGLHGEGKTEVGKEAVGRRPLPRKRRGGGASRGELFAIMRLWTAFL